MGIKRSLMIVVKKGVKIFKRALIIILPKKIINILKILEKKLINFAKAICYTIKDFMKHVLWSRGKVAFDGNEFSTNPFTIAQGNGKSFVLSDVKAGEYKVIVYHNDAYLYESIKSFYVRFDLTSQRKSKSLYTIINLTKRESKKQLPFEYLGGGTKLDDQYKQTIHVSFKEDVKQLKVEFLTQFERYINLNKIYLKDISPLVLDKELIENLRGINSAVVVYADLNINTIDGSSIWLTSLVNILSRFTHVLLLSKDNIRTSDNVLKNIKTDNVTILFPENFRHNRVFTLDYALSALKIIDSECPSVTGLLTRGVELALKIQEDKAFSGRRYVYITDFYYPFSGSYELKYTNHKLEELLFNSDYLLYQTKQIKEVLEKFSNKKTELTTVHLPPTVDLSIKESNQSYSCKNSSASTIKIGYAGKIQPNWGVMELIEVAQKLRHDGLSIELHIASGKISDGDGSQPGFRKLMADNLKNISFITYYKSLSRDECQNLMSRMDYVWSFRPASFENATLEVSTKLIEAVSLGQRAVAYPSVINKSLLGEDYPFYINDPTELRQVITADIDYNIDELSKRLASQYSFESVAKTLENVFPGKSHNEKRILFAGNDLKFLYPYISHLKSIGSSVLIDHWNWGASLDIKTSQEKKDWADVIFCEWGLANAEWYSKNNKERKPLFVRIHAQEVRAKARKFAANIDINNVTKFIFVSETIRDKAIELFSWPIEKTVVIPNFIDDIPFEEKDFSYEIKLGMVGIVPQTKRLDRALDLLERLLLEGKRASLHLKGHRPENLDFMLAPGRRSELDYYDALYSRIEKSASLKKNVYFYEWANDVPLWYKNINVILSPSDNESFHYALADGVMAGAMPVIWPWEGASKIYPRDWITDGSLDSAIELISQYNLSKAYENVNYLKQRYGKSKIYNSISDVIFNEE